MTSDTRLARRGLITRPKEGRVIRFLVELDALQDTRLGLMDTLDPQCAVRLVANPAYFTRLQDKFEPLCGMDDEIFQEAWKHRTKEVLKHSINTIVLDMLHHQVVEVEYRAVEDPTLAGAQVDVNIYPYVLDKAEQEALLLALAQRIGVHSPIRLINQPLRYFTPVLLKQEYYEVILYDHLTWFAAHQEELASDGGVKIPGVVMYVPKLAAQLPPPELCDFTQHGWRKDVDIFDAFGQSMLGLVGLEYLPVNQYCIAFPGVNGIPPLDPSQVKERHHMVAPTELPAAVVDEVLRLPDLVLPEPAPRPYEPSNAAMGDASEDTPL